MSDKEMVSVRLHTDTKRRVERYAEEHDVSRSTAIRRLLEKGADIEEAGLAIAASKQTGGEESNEEKEVVADGGQVVRPMFNFIGAFYAFLSLSMFGLMALAAFGNVVIPYFDYGSLFGMMVSSLLVVAMVMLFLYSDYPEKIDRMLYSGVRRVSRLRTYIGGGSGA